MFINTLSAGANMKSSLFYNQAVECNVVSTTGAAGFFSLSSFGHRENVIEAVERIKKNLK